MDDKRKEPKEPYEAPKLTVHGTLAELTAGGAGSNTDGIDGSLT